MRKITNREYSQRGYPKSGETIAVKDLSISVICGCDDFDSSLSISLPNRREKYDWNGGEKTKVKTVRVIDLRRILREHLRRAAKEIADISTVACGQGMCHSSSRKYENLNHEISFKDWGDDVEVGILCNNCFRSLGPESLADSIRRLRKKRPTLCGKCAKETMPKHTVDKLEAEVQQTEREKSVERLAELKLQWRQAQEHLDLVRKAAEKSLRKK